MLIGCCQCDGYTPPPSESIPSESIPSESTSQSVALSSASSTDFYGCVSCLDSVAPLRYRAVINYTGTTSTNGKCCDAYNQLEYILFNIPGTCTWGSSERALVESNVGTFDCTTGTGAGDIPRVWLRLTGSLLELRYQFLYPTASSTPSYLLFHVPASAVSPIDCLAPHTLPIRSTGFSGFNWSGAHPCKTSQVLPASVSVIPA